jgi:peptide/nickel transport system substrate-binding protein
MLRLRYYSRLITAFLKRFKALIVVGGLIGIVSFFFFRFIGPSLFGRNLIRIGIAGRYQTETLPTKILDQIGDGLTSVNEEGIVEPNLAEKWETTDKGKTWVFHLRQDLEWQNGDGISSEDINYQFTDVEVEKPDEYTVKFILKEPFSPFPTVVSKPVFKKGLLGTGEWRVTNASISGNYVQELVLQNEEKQRKIYKFYPTEERAKLAFKLGGVDVLEEIFTKSPFDTWKTAKIEGNIAEGQIVTLFFNTQQGSILEEKTLRQGLTYAIDKEALGGKRAFSPISPNSWAYNPQVKEYAHDIERAKELIGEPDEQIEIKLVSSPVLLPIAEQIAKDWEKVGVRVLVQVSSVIPTDYQAYLAIFDVPEDPDQYSFWHSTQEATNISRFQNPRIDKLLEDGRVELNTEERKKIYLDFQRFIIEDLPAAFLYHPETYSIVRK